MKKILLISLLSLFVFSCATQQESYAPKLKSKPKIAKIKEHKVIIVHKKPPKPIKIASFNIQVFGKSKAKKQKVMDMIAKVVKHFDIVAIQEIRDKTTTAISTLMKRLGKKYTYSIGERQGRSNSKEQYVFVYDKTKIKQISKGYTYNDSKDIFEREPFIARFKTKKGNFTFVLINIHIKPSKVLSEINQLDDVIASAKQKFRREDDFIVLGDMNADCSYFDENKTIDLKSKKFKWLIGNEHNTTVAKSNCTYDRIIATQGIKRDFKRSGVYRFDKIYNLAHKFTKKVSDHFPVFAEFYIHKDY